MRHLCKSLLRAFFILLLTLYASFALAAEAGRVVALNPNASAQRSGNTLPLELKSAVQAGDTITTDAAGKARILFTDDSTMTIGSNTVLTLQEYSDGGKKPVIKAHLAKGLLRSITGKIVEQNREGFSITTPEATVGIRGTIFVVLRGDNFTTVFVENTSEQVYVNGVLVPAGYKITFPGGKIEPITPEDRQLIAESVAFNGVSVAAAAPEPKNQRGRLPNDQLSLTSQGLVDGLAAGGALPQAASATSASASGTVGTPGLGSFAGTFGFNVNLASGAISGGTLTGAGTGAPLIYFETGFVGGTGTANASGFTISNFGGIGLTGFGSLPPAVNPMLPGTIPGTTIIGGPGGNVIYNVPGLATGTGTLNP